MTARLAAGPRTGPRPALSSAARLAPSAVRLVLAAAMALAAAALPAMEWPLPGAAVARNFGFNDGGRPGLGVALSGSGYALASGPGEIVFSSAGGSSGPGGAARFPSPLGVWAAVDHGNGLVSIYARLGSLGSGGAEEGPGGEGSGAEDQGLGQGARRGVFEAPFAVAQGDPIGAAGSSGWSGGGAGCYFMVYDRRERRWVNPAMVASPLPDAVAPQIHWAQLRAEDGSAAPVAPWQSVAQGRHGVVVSATDALSGGLGSGLAPHRIIVLANGAEIGRLSLETISARDGAMMVSRSGQAPARGVFAPFPAFEAGEAWLNRGQAIIEVIAQDIAGNYARIVAQITVE